MSTDMVQVYDRITEQVKTIPASELAPGMLRWSMVGIEGDVWIDAITDMSGGPIQHPPFGEKLRKIMCRFREICGDVYPLTAEEWEDRFRREMDHEEEIGLWLRAEQSYLHFTHGRVLTDDQKWDIFSVLRGTVNYGEGYVLSTGRYPTLRRKRVPEIVAYFHGLDDGGVESLRCGDLD
jgi:hypothetical protein